MMRWSFADKVELADKQTGRQADKAGERSRSCESRAAAAAAERREDERRRRRRRSDAGLESGLLPI